MRRTFVALLSALGLVASCSAAGACGEKFLVPGGSINAQCVNAPSRTMSILIYGTDASRATAALADKNVIGMLRDVGHKVTVCSSASECSDAVRNGGYDMVLVDASGAKEMRASAASGHGKHSTVVLPVVLTTSRAEFASAKKEFGRVVNASDDDLHILPVINRAAASVR
jgi:hypothetical protein